MVKIHSNSANNACELNLRRPTNHIPILPPIPQRMVDQHQRHHRFGNRRGADADAGVVAAFGGDFHRVARLVRQRIAERHRQACRSAERVL